MANNEKYEELGYRKSLPEEQRRAPRRASKKVSKTGKHKSSSKPSAPQQSTLWSIGAENREKASEKPSEEPEQDSGQVSQQSSSSSLIRLTGLWESSSGALIGNLNQTSKLLIFKNDRKSRASEPDFIAYLSPAGSRSEEPEDESSGASGFKADDIPF